MDFTFHANSKYWNHIHAQFTEIGIHEVFIHTHLVRKEITFTRNSRKLQIANGKKRNNIQTSHLFHGNYHSQILRFTLLVRREITFTLNSWKLAIYGKCHLRISRFTQMVRREITFTPNSWKLSFTEFMLHTNSKKRNHIHTFGKDSL